MSEEQRSEAIPTRSPGPTSVLVMLGGADPVDRDWSTAVVGPRTLVVAADSGLDAATAAGLDVHHLVGDLDSTPPADIARAETAGTEVHRHPADKDATDGELALDLALAILGDGSRDAGSSGHGPRRLTVVGGGGGRLDHLVGDLLALCTERLAPFEVTARLGRATVSIVRPGPGRTIFGRPGDVVSLLAVTGPAREVSTTGLRWALEAGDLAPGSTRGTSNEMVAAEAHVELRRGVLVVIQPDERTRAVEPRSSAYDPSPRLADEAFDGRSGDRA